MDSFNDKPKIIFNQEDKEEDIHSRYCRLYQMPSGQLVFLRNPDQEEAFILFADGSFGMHKLSPAEREEMVPVHITEISTVKI